MFGIPFLIGVISSLLFFLFRDGFLFYLTGISIWEVLFPDYFTLPEVEL